MMLNYYPKNLKASGWGWHRSANAASAVNGFLKGERGLGGSGPSGSGAGSLYPSLPNEDDTVFNAGITKLYPALPIEAYENGEVEEVVEEVCSSVNATAVVSELIFNILSTFTATLPFTSIRNSYTILPSFEQSSKLSFVKK